MGKAINDEVLLALAKKGGGGGGGGTDDYEDLSHKPQVNGHTLEGNKTTSDLGIKFEDLPDAPTIPNDLADLQDDSTHRLVTDTEKATWNGSSIIKNLDNKMLSHSTDSGYITVNLDVNLTAGKTYKVTIRDAFYNYIDTKEVVWNSLSDIVFYGDGISGEYKIQLTQTTVSLYNYNGQGWRDIYCDIVSNYVPITQSDWNESDSTKEDYIKNKPTLGTASAKDVPASGDASSSQVVMGNDSRLTDSRPASDVSSWAKQSTKPTYTASEVGLGNVPNVSTNDQTPTFTEASTRNNIASGEKLSVIFGKIQKFFNDLKTVAFSGSYTDLSDKPTIPTSAGGITYDNTDSGLSATDVQGAVDELAESYPADKVMMSDDVTSVEDAIDALDNSVGTLGDKAVTITADGVKTYSQLLDQLFPYRNRLCRIDIDSTQYYPTSSTRYGHVGGTSNDDINFRLIVIKETGSLFKSATINSETGNISVSNQGSGVPASGTKIKLVKSFMS